MSEGYSTVAENVARKAEEFAWPLNTPKSKYCRFNGGRSTDAFMAYYRAVYPNMLKKSDKSVAMGTCCCHFARTCVSAALGKNISFTFLTSASELVTNMASIGFTKYNFDGNESSLRRGDVLVWVKKGTGGHVWIYLGNGFCAEAAHHSGYAGRITKYTSHKSKLSDKKIYYIFRNGNGGSASGVSYVGGVDTGAGIDLTQTISKLYSTDNYKYVSEDTEDIEQENTAKAIHAWIQNSSYVGHDSSSMALPEPVISATGLDKSDTSNKSEFISESRRLFNERANASLQSIPTFVEGPVIVLDFNGVKIGGFNNSGDTYPNYLTGLIVKKINGKINQYTITLTYAIRAGEDPNFIDKLLSRTGYRNPFSIIYGDATNTIFRDESAIITSVRYNENVSASSITYTISAISSLAALQSSIATFATKTDKPSNLIYDLLYNSQYSAVLLDTFTAMQDKNFVAMNNLIPSSDSIVKVAGVKNTDPITYLSHLVSCMINPSATSTYYLTFEQAEEGAYFKITEVIVDDSSAQNNGWSNFYSLDIGYPSNNLVTKFALCDNVYYSQVYEYNDQIPTWTYGIDDNGNILADKTNSLLTNNKYLNTDLVTSNWWKQVTEFPISAKVTLKGLSKVAMLMTYIKINAMFYGQKDVASGIYVVTEQEDQLNSSGYTTTLTLLRVAGDNASIGF